MAERTARAGVLALVVAVLAATGLVATGPVAITPTVAPAGAAVVVPPADTILAGLRAGHPRIQITPDGVTELRARIAADPTLAGWYANVHQQAHDLLGVPPVVYAKPDGLRLLETCREALRRLQILGLVYLVDGEPEIATRGWAELEAVSAFKDWNPIHFLDVAEMTHAASIGLDWLWAGLTDAQRTTVTDAIRVKGLTPARAAYDGSASPLYSW